MKKRLFAIMLALALVLAAVPALAEEGAVEQDNTAGKKICTTEGCSNEVTNEGDLCADCAAKKAGEEAARKAAEEEAAKKAKEEAAKRVAEEAAKKAAEEAVRKAAEEELKKSPMLLGEANANNNGETCEHQWTYQDAQSSDSTHYCYQHKKTCSKCKIEVWENHAWDRDKQEVVEESTCTEQGKDKLPCKLCSHVTYVSRELKPHTKDNGTIITAATCTGKGKIKYTCTVCKCDLPEEEIPALGHSYGSPSWSWCGFTSAKATFTCTRNCGHSETETASIVRNSINSCGYYTYTATVQFNGKTYTDTRTDYSCRPDWYYDDCYYRNTCGHWGCGDVCTRYSDCVPCRNYRTTFRVGGYNCLATPKTGDVSVIGMALISLAGAGAAIMGKKRK